MSIQRQSHVFLYYYLISSACLSMRQNILSERSDFCVIFSHGFSIISFGTDFTCFCCTVLQMNLLQYFQNFSLQNFSSFFIFHCLHFPSHKCFSLTHEVITLSPLVLDGLFSSGLTEVVQITDVHLSFPRVQAFLSNCISEIHRNEDFPLPPQ